MPGFNTELATKLTEALLHAEYAYALATSVEVGKAFAVVTDFELELALGDFDPHDDA